MSRFLLSSFCLVLLYPTAIDLYLVGLPQIAAELNATESQLHIAFSIYLAGMATTMLLAGKLADSLGRKPVAITGAVIFIAASLLGGAAEQVGPFLMARFAQGIGAGSCYVVAFAILRDTLDDTRRAKVLSMINGITCIIPVIAPVVGYLIMLSHPWQSLFATMAGMGSLVLLLSATLLRETKPNKAPADTAVPITTERFSNRYFISRLVITSLGCTVILTYVNVSPMLIMGNLGFDRGGYSSVMAFTAAVSMLAAFSTPFALSIFKDRTLMLTAQGLFGLAAISVSFASALNLSVQWYLFSFALICAGFSIGYGVTMNQALSPFSLRAGVASSLLGVSQVCLSAFYIWVMGLFGVTAENMLIFILAFSSIVCLALILLIPNPIQAAHYEEIHHTS
ncbi:MFS transporter [Shewanella spartinae]|uniref:MFS transporter n=1 Tax=Shewanella spartinae TaxID=2864205 RepID=UPI001C657615|nr:MFS transporter [Shewanella spartinae]QYJ93026.1 MFS transporter [Shewanella spartinae]